MTDRIPSWGCIARWLRCRLKLCPGRIISGVKYDGREFPGIFIGWRCVDCGAVKHYEEIEP